MFFLKRKASYFLTAFCLFSMPLLSQIPAGAVKDTEKRPTSRDPRYAPSLVPPSLKEDIKPGMQSLFSPGGEVDAESLLKEQQGGKKKQMSRHNEQRDEDLMNYDEYLFFQKSLSSQFGVNSFHLGSEKQAYRETAGRRFQIVFFTSLPVTGALCFGAAALAKGSSRMNGPQTAGIALSALLFSGGIGWYDIRRWKKGRTFQDEMHKDASELSLPPLPELTFSSAKDTEILKFSFSASL